MATAHAEYEAEAIRRLRAVKGEATADTLRANAQGIAARLKATTYDPGRPDGVAGFAREVRGLAGRRFDYLAMADFVESGASGAFAPDPAERARVVGLEAVRAFVRARWPESLSDFLARAQGALGRRRAYLAPAVRADGSLISGDLDADLSAGRLAVGEYHDRLVGRQVIAAERRPGIESLSAALAAWPEAFARRVAEAVDASGGADALAGSILESSMLEGSPFPQDPGAYALQQARGRLAELDAKLARLGIAEPAKLKSPPPGLAAATLWGQRRDLSSSIRKASDEVDARSLARCRRTIDEAASGDLPAWQLVRDRAKLAPTAFPVGFLAAWDEAPLLAVADAGADALASVLDEN